MITLIPTKYQIARNFGKVLNPFSQKKIVYQEK